ncbi:MAG: response regulator [Desulfuromonadaceae bacterium]|nr:response regulator [Desulfuromonadaceae bacterium]
MKNILIIEQTSEITALLEAALSDHDTFVQSVGSEQAGLLLLAEHPFDVVITDITSQEFKNVEIIRRINDMERRPRVIAMTGFSGSQNREYLSSMAETLSIEHLLFKPFSMSDLRKLIFRCEGDYQADLVA